MGTNVLGKSFRSSRPVELCIIGVWCLHQLSVLSPVKIMPLTEGLLLVRRTGSQLCDVENNYLVWKHCPFHGEKPIKLRRAGTWYLLFPSAPKCCKHMVMLPFVSVHSSKMLYSLQLWGENFFSSMVSDWSQHNVILQHFLCNLSFSSFYSFSQILKKSQWKTLAEN